MPVDFPHYMLASSQNAKTELDSVFFVTFPNNICLTSLWFCFAGFKRGADPGMPEPTVLRYGNFDLTFVLPVKSYMWFQKQRTESCEMWC